MAQLSLKVESKSEEALRAIAEAVEKIVTGINAVGVTGAAVKLAEANMRQNTGGTLDFGMVAKG